MHAGLLADLRLESHRSQIAELGIAAFDLLVSNLYPFSATVASGATPDECIEQIDIGGPAMVRSSAKNHASVAVVTSPGQYPALLAALEAGGFTLAERQALAAEAFAHTAAYDVAVAGWLRQEVTEPDEPFSTWAGATYRRTSVLRYGENPHQQAALYRDEGGPLTGLAAARQLHGKPMSYNTRRRRCRPAERLRLRRARRGDHQARQPVWHRGRCGHRRRTPQGTRLRPCLGVRRVIAANRPISAAMASIGRGVHRGGAGARLRGRGAGGV